MYRELSWIALGAVAGAYARAGLSGEGIEMLDQIGDAGCDQIALAEIAAMLARQGRLSEAIAAADRLRAPQLYALAVTKIPAIEYRRGRTSTAAGMLKQAETAVLDIERPFAADTALAQIATGWADLNEPEKGFGNIAKVKSAALGAQTLWEVAMKSMARDTDAFSRAIAATEKIESALDRADTYARAARDYSEAQIPMQARQVFDLTVRETKAIYIGWWRARILSLLATVLIKI